ncbi:MAG: hypothetical protein AAB316_13460 [Bacteroidota bacterium]
MGLFINYKGKLNDVQDVPRIIAEFKDIAESMKWYFRIEDRDWNLPDDVHFEAHPEFKNTPVMVGHAGIKGICFKVHDHCEPIYFFFNREGILMDEYQMAFNNSILDRKQVKKMPWIFTKTSNAGMEAHQVVCKLLRYAKKKYFEVLKVKDDTGFWKSSDSVELKTNMEIMSTIIGIFSESEERKQREGGKSLLDKLLEKGARQDEGKKGNPRP